MMSVEEPVEAKPPPNSKRDIPPLSATFDLSAVPRRVDLYRSSMHAEYGWFFRRTYGARFRRIEPDLAGCERVREAATRGTIVYIMGRRAVLEYIFFNWYFLRHNLPLSRFANGVNMLVWSPLRQAIRTALFKVWLRGRKGPLPDPVDGGFMRRRVLAGQSVLLFLKREGGIFRRPQLSKRDLIGEVIKAQQNNERPIFLVPQTIVWQRRPDRVRPGMLDLLFGSDENPGRFTRTLHFLLYSKGAVVRMGEPIDLQKFLAEHKDEPVDVLARKLRWVLRGYLYRERRSVKGPQVKPQAWMFNVVRNDPEIRRRIEVDAGDNKAALAVKHKEVDSYLRQIAANLDWDTLHAVRWFFDLVINRIYDGVELGEDDIEIIRTAVRRGPVLFLPCHRSHLDYILISWVLFHRYVMPPHVAAGINLSFWPAGPILRRCGAFFLRRTFDPRGLYGLVFKKYVHALIREGYPSEFFIEGGRSRTGRLLLPKTGMLRMYVEAVVDQAAPDLLVLPIGIGYERIVEERAYQKELAGGSKQKEDMRGLAKSARVLSRNYGRVHLKVEPPFRLGPWLSGLAKPWKKMDEDERRTAVSDLARILIFRIGRALVATPSMVSATCLLGVRDQGIEYVSYLARFESMKRLLIQLDVPLSEAMELGEASAIEAVEQFERQRAVDIVDDEEVGRFITLDPERRERLDYYRNGLVVHLVMGMYLAAAMGDWEDHPIAVETVIPRVNRWVRLFHRELFIDPQTPVQEQVENWLACFERLNVVSVNDGEITIVDTAIIDLLATNLGPLRESYRLTRQVQLRDDGITRMRDEWIKEILAEGKRRRLLGKLSYPEVLNRITLQNALEMLRLEGVLAAETQKGSRTSNASVITEFFGDPTGLPL